MIWDESWRQNKKERSFIGTEYNNIQENNKIANLILHRMVPHRPRYEILLLKFLKYTSIDELVHNNNVSDLTFSQYKSEIVRP